MRHLFDRRLLFFGGKGGVGKTTCASAVALAGSRAARRVLLVSTDPAHSTSDMFERPIGPEEREIQPGLWACEVDADREVVRYVEDVRNRIGRLFSPAVVRAALRQIELAATMPGVVDVALFDRLSSIVLDRRAAFDLVVVDTAPTGHTLRLLQMPELMGTWIDALAARRRAALAGDGSGPAGDEGDAATKVDPILAALEQRGRSLAALRGLLADVQATGFVFVVIAERLAIEETVRAVETLHASRLPIAGVVVNRVLPEHLEGDFYRARLARERAYRDEIERRLASIPRASVRELPADVHGLQDLEAVAHEILG